MMHLPKGTGTFPLPCDALIARLYGPQGLLLMGHEMGLSFFPDFGRAQANLTLGCIAFARGGPLILAMNRIPSMRRLLATLVFAHAGLSAAQWAWAAGWLHGSRGPLGCGNVISDPYMLLVNVGAPLAMMAIVVLICRSLKVGRWPGSTIAALLTFVATSGCLALEGYLLISRYGVPLGDVWWLPWL